MLTSSGTTSLLPTAPQDTPPALSSRPAPTMPPIRACVVDTGNRRTVASATQKHAPARTATANYSFVSPLMRPLENRSVIFDATASDHTQPTRVVAVPHKIAGR